jgi:O-antigen/teichoic acid export membrane protein/ubiquinone/menaquinone biosynthesis C-methylase UbiE
VKHQARFLKAFAWNHAGRLIEYCLMYLFSVLIARTLGADKNGEYAVFLSFTQLLLIISSLGFENSISAYFSKLLQETSHENVGGVFRHLLLLRLAGIIILGGIAFIAKDILSAWMHFPISVTDAWFIVILYFSFRSVVSLLTSFQIAKVQTATIAFINIAVRLVELIGAYILISNGGGIKEIFLLIVITAAGQIGGYVILLKELFTGTAPAQVLKSIRSLSGKFWLNSIIEFILGRQTDILLLSYFMIGTQLIGQYDVASAFALLINIGLTTGMYGLIVRSFSTMEVSNRQLLPSYWEFLTRVVIVLVVPVFIATSFFANEIIPLIYSEKYSGSIPFFQVLSVFLISTRLMGGGIAADYLQASGNVRLLLISSIVSGLSNLVLALILIPKYGALGAVFATGLAALVIAGMHGYYSRKLLHIRFPLRTGILIILGSLASAVVIGELPLLFPTLYIVVSLIIYEILFLILCYFIKPFTMKDLEFLEALPLLWKKILCVFARYSGKISVGKTRKIRLTDRQKYGYWWTPESGVLLDIGSSDSNLPIALCNKANTVFAIDRDVEALRRIHAQDDRIKISEASAEYLPFGSNSADTVLLLDVLEHTNDEERVVNEIARVLKPAGTLIISVPNKGIFSFLDPQNLSAKFKKSYSPEKSHRHYSEADLMRLLGSRFRMIRKHTGGLFLYPVAFYLDHFFKKYLKVDWSPFFRTFADWDNDISWGTLSYNIILQLEKV